jgi:exopolysaccharide production protein ExoZ
VNRLLSIQYLRAVAVLMVLGYHACLFGWRTGFEIGAAGVDVFFVISGFILWTIAAERPQTPGRFLLKRLGRVAPLYWLVTLAVAGLALWRPGMIFDADPTAPHLALSMIFVHHLNPSGRPDPVLPVGWSLNDEALFYLIFAASLFAPQRWRFRALVIGLVGVVVTGTVFYKLYYLGYNMMFFQFIAGAWLAKRRLEGRLPSAGWGWMMLLWAIAIFAVLEPFDLYQTLMRPFTWGAPALALVAGAVTLEARKPLPNIPVLRFIGDASYSIYLVHWPVVSALKYVMNSNQLIYLPLAIGLSLAAGAILHIWVERPLLRLFHERLAGVALPSGAT